MNKNYFAKTPPMGWNSYDYYDTTVTEADIKANADYMAEDLKKYGYEYVVVDIEWYAEGAGSRRDEYQYIPFGKVDDGWLLKAHAVCSQISISSRRQGI